MEIPIIFITGHSDIPISVRAMKAGAVEFLIKPFSDQDLIEAIQQAIERDRLSRRRAEKVGANLDIRSEAGPRHNHHRNSSNQLSRSRPARTPESES
jgi:FixJ family two-component response regulator